MMHLNGCELSMSVTALANALARQLSDQDLALAITVFSQMSTTLATISTQRALCAGTAGRQSANSAVETAGLP
ncbi:MAG: hypothetical protein HFE86_08100 [Clostridiales bacterium]|nr:hypothetical protein [Clostridiales bacterium]